MGFIDTKNIKSLGRELLLNPNTVLSFVRQVNGEMYEPLLMRCANHGNMRLFELFFSCLVHFQTNMVGKDCNFLFDYFGWHIDTPYSFWGIDTKKIQQGTKEYNMVKAYMDSPYFKGLAVERSEKEFEILYKRYQKFNKKKQQILSIDDLKKQDPLKISFQCLNDWAKNEHLDLLKLIYMHKEKNAKWVQAMINNTKGFLATSPPPIIIVLGNKNASKELLHLFLFGFGMIKEPNCMIDLNLRDTSHLKHKGKNAFDMCKENPQWESMVLEYAKMTNQTPHVQQQ